MKDKEKQIEELVKLLHDKNATIEWWDYYNDDYNPSYKKELKNVASIIYNAGYRKIPEDSVVLSKEEYENIYEQAEQNVLANIADGGTSCHWCEEENQKIGYEKGSKETAEKLREEIITLSQELVNSRKETTEKLIKLVYTTLTDRKVWIAMHEWWLEGKECPQLKALLNEIAKQFGVEIKE